MDNVFKFDHREPIKLGDNANQIIQKRKHSLQVDDTNEENGNAIKKKTRTNGVVNNTQANNQVSTNIKKKYI